MNPRVCGSRSFVPGVRPVIRRGRVFKKLKTYPVPELIYRIVHEISKETVESINISDSNDKLKRLETQLPYLACSLNIYSYTRKMHNLLHLEEIQIAMDMKRLQICKTSLNIDQDYLTLEVPGLSERKPTTIQGDRVTVKEICDYNQPAYEGFVHAMKNNKLLLKFHPNFHEAYTGHNVSVEFYLSRTAYKRCHKAIDLAASYLGRNILFPETIVYKFPQINIESIINSTWHNDELNDWQKTAVNNILLGVCRPMPYCIYGPPGTGKTITVIETILQILKLLPYSRILVATPSNSAANYLTERLLQYGECVSSSIIRLISRSAVNSEKIPSALKPFCATIDMSDNRRSQNRQMRNEGGVNINCGSYFISRHRVTIATCLCVGQLAQMKISRYRFTHVIVDEAGQANEAEIMIPLTQVNTYDGQIILAGDPMQLGPVVFSKFASYYGLQKSYMSRLLSSAPYQYDQAHHNNLVTMLRDNYRSVESVLCLPSSMFYDNSLVAKVTGEEEWIARMLLNIADLLPNGNQTGGIFMKGIRGVNYVSPERPSWFNPDEASSVFTFTCDLYSRNISPNDIGIITPYISQIRYLRQLFVAAGVELPKIGSVEEFQGQEKPIILISTVRSAEVDDNIDVKRSFGFTNDPKRINVALTRAKVIIVLFSNPHLLCQDFRWRMIVQHIVNKNCYTGCTLPVELLAEVN